MAVSVLVLAAWTRGAPAAGEKGTAPSKWYLWAATRALLVLALFRALVAHGAFGGQLTAPDEGPFSRIYVSALMEGAGAYGGASQLALGILYAAWYKFTGSIGVPLTRVFTSLLVTGGILVTFFLVRRELGRGAAFLTAIFLSASAWALLFSALSIEPSSLFLSVPLVLLLLAWKEKHNRGVAAPFAAGFLSLLASLSYPGAAFYFGALFLSFLIVDRRATLAWLLRRDALPFAGGIALALGFALVLHFHLLHPSKAEAIPYAYAPFLGTGLSAAPAWQYLDAAFLTFQETFFGGRSIYLDRFPHEPLLAASLWGFFLVGARAVWKGSDPRLKALLLSVPVLLLLCCLLPNVSGLRRALGALPAAHLICALGVLELWRALSAKKALRGALFSAVAVCLGMSVFVLAPKEMRAFAGSATPAIPDALLREELGKGGVVLDLGSFRGPHGNLDAFVTRASGALLRSLESWRPGGRVYFPDDPDLSAPCATLLSWPKGRPDLEIPLPRGYSLIDLQEIYTPGIPGGIRRLRLQREGATCRP